MPENTKKIVSDFNKFSGMKVKVTSTLGCPRKALEKYDGESILI